MADNTTLNTGSGGDTIATDDISGVKHQRVKIQYGDDGSATDVSDTNPLPIDDAGGSITVDGTVTANLSATDNAVLDSIAAAQLADGHNVTVDNASGASAVNIQDGGNSITVDGTVTANLSATDNAVLDSIAAGQLADGHNVTIDNASGASAVNIQDGGNSITIDGTVTANLSATDNAVLDNIQTAVEIIDNIVSGSEAQVDVVAALPAGSNVIGGVNLAAQTTGGATPWSSIDLDESEEQVKGSAGTLYSLYVWNATAAPLWLQIFDNTSASVTVGTTAPDYNFPIPANADSDVAGVTIPLPPMGLQFSTGITLAVTTGSGTNAGAPGANEAGAFLAYE